MMARIFGFVSAASFVASFIAFTWLRGLRYRARRILEADGAEPEPSDVDAAVVHAVDSDLAGQERVAWVVWGVLVAAFVGFGLAAVLTAGGVQ